MVALPKSYARGYIHIAWSMFILYFYCIEIVYYETPYNYDKDIKIPVVISEIFFVKYLKFKNSE